MSNTFRVLNKIRQKNDPLPKLFHYYEAKKGPFLNLSDLPLDEAEQILNEIRQDKRLFASQRPADYLNIRRTLEAQVRALFIQKGGKPRRSPPHYMAVGACPWLKQWYLEGAEIQLSLAQFEADIISFTYGDTFPAMRYQDGKPYRGQVYTLAELPTLIRTYGLPQDWNADGQIGPERYIEAQIWHEAPLNLST